MCTFILCSNVTQGHDYAESIAVQNQDGALENHDRPEVPLHLTDVPSTSGSFPLGDQILETRAEFVCLFFIALHVYTFLMSLFVPTNT